MNQEALLWELVKNNNSKLIKRNGLKMSTDSGNPQGVQRKSMCGLSQSDRVEVSAVRPDAKKRNVVHFNLGLGKERRFEAKTRKESVQHHQSSVVVKRVHSAVKVVKAQAGRKNPERTAMLVKKIAKLHRANVK